MPSGSRERCRVRLYLATGRTTSGSTLYQEGHHGRNNASYGELKSTVWPTALAQGRHLEHRLRGSRWVCVACGTAVRSYEYRCHPAESPRYERCIGLCRCPGCHSYTAAMVHVPRDRAHIDALASLRPEHREQLKRNEGRLIEYLDSHAA